eukprot:TRINITY_DN2968_c0_g1_i1.p1 TRINITY_DN2968_c0_g1~~TRINITY_DN2968_c0_g1_i1.p1  ORF type:complete len:1208 (-),score=299.05 TRINITY_DN2968_c0_g1_i1:27-3650(-)
MRLLLFFLVLFSCSFAATNNFGDFELEFFQYLTNSEWTELRSTGFAVSTDTNCDKLSGSQQNSIKCTKGSDNKYYIDTIIHKSGTLMTIPSYIYNLPKLTYLNLDSNSISKLPSLPKMKLRYLSLETNLLTSVSLLPQLLSTNLTNLLTLSVVQNELSSFPDLPVSSPIQDLSISMNSVSVLPSSLFNCPALQKLNAEHNSISVFPTIPEGCNLTELGFLGNKITSFPNSFTNLKSLSVIDIQGNSLSALPEAFFSMPHLVSAYLDGNGISSLPSISENSPFEYLLLSSNLLSTLPISISNMNNLATLNLLANSLTALPSSFFYLKNLKELDLSRNAIPFLPEIPGKLAVSSLWLTSNDLSCVPATFKNLNPDFLNMDSNLCLEIIASDVVNVTTLSCASTCTTYSKCTNSNNCLSYYCSNVGCECIRSESSCNLGYCIWNGGSTCFLPTRMTCGDIKTSSICNSITSRVQTLSCAWCESSGECISNSDYSTSCVQCSGISLQSKCESKSKYCVYCPNENLCKNKGTECLKCENQTASVCSSLSNCKYCTLFGVCKNTTETCPSCNSNCDLSVCKKCSSTICVGKNSTCTDCSTFSNNDCENHSGCKVCSSSQECQSDLDACQSCTSITSGSICRSNDGCSWCDSSQLCLNKTMSATCKNCTEIQSSSCNSNNGCKWCEVDKSCLSKSISCSTCRSKTQSQCYELPSTCSWCQLSKYCGNSTSACLSCPMLNSEIICKKFSECKWNSKCISASEESQKSSSSSSTIIIAVVISVLFALICLAVGLFVLKRRHSTESITEMGTTSLKFSEMSERTINSALEQEINMLTPFSEVSDLGLSVSPSEVAFKTTFEINQPQSTKMTITNIGSGTVDVLFFYSPSRDPHLCELEPNHVTLTPKSSASISLNLTMCCTCRLKTKIAIVSKGKGYAFVPLSAESAPSSYLSMEEVQLGKVLGKGSFGKVYLGRYRGETVAVKQLNVTQSDICAIQTESVEQEIKMMTQLRSPYIVSFFGAMRSSESIYIALEYCKQGSLTSHLGEHKLNSSLKQMIALDCARGMQYLHMNRVIHRDLKTENVLLVSLSEKSTIRGKISDFGTSRVVGSGERQQMTAAVGTPSFIAPEVLSDEKTSVYSLPSDVYSFAILLWHLWTETEPYSDFKTVFAIYAFVQEGKRLPVPENCPFSDIIERSWNQNPENRPSFDEIVSILGSK